MGKLWRDMRLMQFGAGGLLASSALCASSAARAQDVVPNLGAPATELHEPATPTKPASPSVAPETSNGSGIQDIVVTAERRASSVQRTPIAISAIAGDVLRKSGVSDIAGLGQRVPNLTFERNSGAALIFIRGIGYSAIAPGGETRVALYTDGLYQSRTQAGLLGFYDIDRVEVLRGPQGTLYGRNAIAGTINLLTRDPSSEFHGFVSGTVGDYGLVATEGGVGGPLSSNVQARIAFRTVDRNGFGRNINTGEDVDDEHSRSARGKLKFIMSDALTLRLSGDYTVKRDHSAGYNFVGASNAAIVPLGLRISDSFAPTRPHDAAGLGPFQRIETYGASAQGDVGIADGTDLVLLSGYRRLNSFLKNTVDGFTSELTQHFVTEQSDSFSQEIRLSQRVGKFANVILGGYYFHEANSVLNEAPHKGLVFAPAFGLQAIINPNQLYEFFGTFGRVKTNAYALFGQANVKVTDRIELDLGARYSKERKRLFEQKQLDLLTPFIQGNSLNAGFNPPRGLLGGQNQLRLNASSFDPKVTLSFQATDTLFLYATYSRGFKSGGFNIGGLQDPFRPEKLTNYETGIKVDLFDRRLRANLSAFNYDYKDLQLSLVEGNNLVTRNAAAARIKGLEAEITARPTQRLTLTLNGAYLDAKFRNYRNADPTHPNLGVQNLTGFRLPNAPKYQANAGASYEIATSIGTFTPRGEVSFVAKNYFNEFNTVEFTQPRRTLVNLFLNWESGTGGLSASAFVKNLTDKVYISNAVASNGLLGFPKLGQFGDPRTFGLIVTKKF